MTAKLTKAQELFVKLYLIDGAWFSQSALKSASFHGSKMYVMTPGNTPTLTTVKKLQALIDKGVFVEGKRELTIGGKVVTQDIWVYNVR